MLVVLLLIVAREKSLDLSSRKQYIQTMCFCIACLAMDILSVVAIVYASQGSFPHNITLLICKVYLVFLINQGYAGFLYVSGEFFAEGTHQTLRRVYRLILICGSVAIMLLPIEYYCEGRVVYSLGPSTWATYVLAFILLVSTVVMAFLINDATSRLRRRCILIWQGGWLAAALLQLVRPDLLVVGFGAAFGLVIVYAELENPHEGIDRLTGQFTSNALGVYLRDLYRRKQDFAAMHVYIDYGSMDLETETAILIKTANFLDDEQNSQIFRHSDSGFSVIYDNRDDMMAGYGRAAEFLGKAVDLPVRFSYILIPDSGVFMNADEFQQYRHHNENSRHVGETMMVTAAEAEQMREYMNVRDKISWSLANDRIEVFYQPIYDLNRRRFTSAEALVRIRDKDGSLVMPGSFIPVAEENGLIIPLGIEVFRQVCKFLATGIPQKYGIEYIEVNLSMAQFDQDNPASFVQQLLSRYRVDPQHINLEITETADAVTRQAVLKNMNTLIGRGIGFSLDDFGTGRSNLDYFVTMPVDIIKFDYKFTHWYFESERARKVIEGTVDIIKSVGLPIVAEGIETEEQLYAMKALGITFIQGYYFSKPLPQSEFVAFLKANRDPDNNIG